MLRDPADFGTAEEAKAMLEKAVAAVKENKAKALDMFNKGEGGFKDRDLYVYCANASDGIFTAHPTLKGEQLRDIKGKNGVPLGASDHGECHRGNDKRDHLLVAASWLRQAAREDHLLHEGRRSDLRSRLLQVNSFTDMLLVAGSTVASLAMTCLSKSGPTEISPVNGRL